MAQAVPVQVLYDFCKQWQFIAEREMTVVGTIGALLAWRERPWRAHRAPGGGEVVFEVSHPWCYLEWGSGFDRRGQFTLRILGDEIMEVELLCLW